MQHIVHFNNGTGGGVFTVIKNLIEFSNNEGLSNHVIFTIDRNKNNEFVVPIITKATSVQVFYYSSDWNFYYTCLKLQKLLPTNNSILIAHDWLELGMASILGLQNTVVLFLHGDYQYYYDLACRNNNAIDLFIPVASNIEKNLKLKLGIRIDAIEYLQFPVASAPLKLSPGELFKDKFKIIFIGRLSSDKGYDLLPEIATALFKNNVDVEWHIVGEKDKNLGTVFWAPNISVLFYGEIPNVQILRLLPDIDYILLPSKFEGMPVVLIEAMKAGVIPIVSNISGGIQELVIENETGFKIQANDVQGYINSIIDLNNNWDKRKTLRVNCIKLANQLFDPVSNTLKIENRIIQSANENKIKKATKVYGSRLDSKWIPNLIVVLIRNFLKKH